MIGPYFFEDGAGNAVTVNGERYRNMITEFLWPQLDGMDLEDMWFQQDGATCHTARETTDLLREKFPASHISRNGDQNWPLRPCDLTACDYFLWGLVKSRVMSTSHEQFLSSSRRFDVSLAKLSRNYAGRSSKILSKEEECASRVAEDICLISCSTINRSKCTLY